MVKLLFSLFPVVPSSVVLVDPIETSLVSNSEEGLFWLSGIGCTSSLFSTEGREFSVEASTPWDGVNKAIPINTEATPTENFRIEKRWRLLKISFILPTFFLAIFYKIEASNIFP